MPDRQHEGISCRVASDSSQKGIVVSTVASRLKSIISTLQITNRETIWHYYNRVSKRSIDLKSKRNKVEEPEGGQYHHPLVRRMPGRLAPVADSFSRAILFAKLTATRSPVLKHAHTGACRFQSLRRGCRVSLFLILGHFRFLPSKKCECCSHSTLRSLPGAYRSRDPKTPAGRLTTDKGKCSDPFVARFSVGLSHNIISPRAVRSTSLSIGR